MDANKTEMETGGNSTANNIRIKKTDVIDRIINNLLVSKVELGITVFPINQYFKSYLLEIKPKYLIIDSLMPFFGNKIMPNTEYIKISAVSSKYNIERYFFSKYKDKIIFAEEINFLIFKPLEIVIIEKRKVLRVSVENNNAAYLYGSYKNNDFFYPVHDLSWNGISFDCDFPIESGSVLKNNSLKFFGKTANMDLRIVHSTFLNGKYRIGCYIENISENDRDLLINFILVIERQNINVGIK